MSNMITRINQWNLERNGLEFDPLLEIQMLSEEAREFMTAESQAEKLREAADFLFVLNGTTTKFAATKYTSVHHWQKAWDGYQDLIEWAEDISNQILVELKAEGIVDLLDEALEAVVVANETKGSTKNADGKVIKGADYKDPMPTIRGLVLSHNERNRPLWN